MESAERMNAAAARSARLIDPPSRPLDRLSVGSGLPLSPIDPNHLGLRLLPGVGPQIVVVRLAGQQPTEDALHVDDDVEVVDKATSSGSPSSVLLALYSNRGKAGVSPIIGTEGRINSRKRCFRCCRRSSVPVAALKSSTTAAIRSICSPPSPGRSASLRKRSCSRLWPA